MLKWRRRSTGNILDEVDGDNKRDIAEGREEETFSRSYNEAELLSSLASDSPFEELVLEEVYKRFTEENKKDSFLTADEAFIVQPLTKCRRPKSERRPSPASLPSIEEGNEYDELASIADSGICDDDFDFEVENRYKNNIQNNSLNRKSYFEPLKNAGDEEFFKSASHDDGDLLQDDGDLLASINEELHKRKDSEKVDFLEQAHMLSQEFLNKLDEQHTEEKRVRLSSIRLDNTERLPRIDSTAHSSTQTRISHVETTTQISPSLCFEEPLNTSSPTDIDCKNNQIFNRLKLKADLHNPTLNGACVTSTFAHIELPCSLMSSMLWNGETSTRPPSTVDIYQTMPPNRYPKRNKDFMTQLTSQAEEENKRPLSTKEFKVNLDVNHYSPDEIMVTLEDGKLVVNGKHFSESEYGFESCQFHRRYPIPDGIKKTEIKSQINEDGILTITGKLSPPQVKAKPKVKTRLSRYDNVDGAPHSPTQREPPVSPASLPSPTNFSTSPDFRRDSPDGSPSSPLDIELTKKMQSPKDSFENDFYETEEDTYVLKVSCASYNPKDMEVRVSGRELVIRGKQKFSQIEDGHERIRYKQFTKRFSVPRNADVDTITSRFTNQDILIVEVQKNNKER